MVLSEEVVEKGKWVCQLQTLPEVLVCLEIGFIPVECSLSGCPSLDPKLPFTVWG